ncbi:hypothetical protein [Agromyces arachidis]|uniref:hypothetical protein n=1 Tax=Agromyces arachidis TaxID=766966 RepID=UPI004057BFE8
MQRSVVRRRTVLPIMLAVSTLFGIVGCAGVLPPACTTIGYLQHLDIMLEGRDVGDVERVVLCSERGCSVTETELETTPPTGPWYVSRDLGSGRWRVDLDLDAPKHVTIELIASDGTTLQREATRLEWTRVGGSERCGGPQATDAVVIEVQRSR